MIWDASSRSLPVPESLRDLVEQKRQILVEAIAETDDVLLTKYLEGEDISSEELRAGLRKATLAGQLVPVLCGAALRNKGVQPVLDAIVDYLPSPLDVPPSRGFHRRVERGWCVMRIRARPLRRSYSKSSAIPFWED